MSLSVFKGFRSVDSGFLSSSSLARGHLRLFDHTRLFISLDGSNKHICPVVSTGTSTLILYSNLVRMNTRFLCSTTSTLISMLLIVYPLNRLILFTSPSSQALYNCLPQIRDINSPTSTSDPGVSTIHATPFGWTCGGASSSTCAGTGKCE